jgi:hypothetical protein
MAADQEETIAFLERATSYGPSVAAVERIGTHASVPVLGGRACLQAETFHSLFLSRLLYAGAAQTGL